VTEADRVNSCPLVLAGESLLLHPQRALLWPARSVLFVADLHLGKSDVFRRSGIPIPEGTTATDLERLDRLVAAHGLSRIVLLGDFLHAAADTNQLEPYYAQAFTQWRAARPQLEFVVVAGNHDRRAAGRELADIVQWQAEGWREGPFVCRHYPGAATEGYVLSGHVHPTIRLQGSHRERMRVPVCWVRPDYAVLPSFGSFTGGGHIEPQPEDELFAFAANRVWRLPRCRAKQPPSLPA
jgi:DNA ligase-associated metallophosphoesterase